MKLEARMSRSIKQRAGVVVLRSDFSGMASDSQIGRVLARFVTEGKLVRVSKGAFAKTRINKFTGQSTVAGTLETIATELFRKLNIDVELSTLVTEHNSGKSTQTPTDATVSTGRRRISRNVQVGKRSLTYEKATKRA